MPAETSEQRSPSEYRVLSLLSDPGNRQLLEGWIDEHPSYACVAAPADIEEADFDICIIDKRAFEELLRNAVRHSDRDAPSIAIDVSRREDTVEIRIADDGPGIPDMEYRIFEEDAEIEPLVHASVLGPWLVYLIVRASDGAVRFEENEPRGSVIVIELPAGPPAESTRVRGS
jgi:signal transduction histidine kinase